VAVCRCQSSCNWWQKIDYSIEKSESVWEGRSSNSSANGLGYRGIGNCYPALCWVDERTVYNVAASDRSSSLFLGKISQVITVALWLKKKPLEENLLESHTLWPDNIQPMTRLQNYHLSSSPAGALSYLEAILFTLWLSKSGLGGRRCQYVTELALVLASGPNRSSVCVSWGGEYCTLVPFCVE
jgi:hypothetical protein